MRARMIGMSAALLAATASTHQADRPTVSAPVPARPVIARDGSVRVPSFVLPPSGFMSPEAADQLRLRAAMPVSAPEMSGGDIARTRAGLETLLAPLVALMRSRYPTDMTPGTIAGVPVRTFVPKRRAARGDRVLINLHGGAFMMCADACASLESIPIAAVGGYRVVSVDYRQGPEHRFPAATEDVVAVYRSLLKTYRPSQIGIYGCSAGGGLSAEVAAWLPAHGLPEPGAIGIFGSGADYAATGDSAYIAAYADGSSPPPAKDGSPEAAALPYFAGVDLKGASVSPARHLDVLARFPPTLVITSTRAGDLSPAVYTHAQLVKAGIPGDLIVGEGLGHCYIYSANLPEAQDAYRTIARFFDTHLR